MDLLANNFQNANKSRVEKKIEETFERYGMNWRKGTHPLKIEFYFIKHLGYAEKDGKKYGNGLSFHLERAKEIVWPHLDAHRWHNLCRDKIAEHPVCCLLGPGSSGKTNAGAWTSLLQWLANPEETCVLVSSTDMRGLRLRVWGEITSLWEAAVSKFTWLPGHMLDSKLAITSTGSAMDEGDYNDRVVRNFRSAIIGIPTIQTGKQVGLGKWIGIKQKNVILVADECFPAGTLVDTPFGARAIETIKAGDIVWNAIGAGIVRGVGEKVSTSLVSVRLRNGKAIPCTPNHPFLTQFGWVQAGQLNQTHYIVSTDEAVRILQDGINATAGGAEATVLQSELLRQMDAVPTGLSRQVLHQSTRRENIQIQTPLAQREPGAICRSDNQNALTYATAGSRTKDQSIHIPPGYGMEANSQGRQWNRANQSGKTLAPSVSGSDLQSRDLHREKGRQRLSNFLQSRYIVPGFEIGNRSGWEFPLGFNPEGTGCQKNRITVGAWVDSVEAIQPEDFGRHGGSEGGVKVYTLEVEGHHSYSVNGLLVQNCQFMGSSFLSAFANLNKNERFQAIVLGNPVDTLDPLGKAAEPLDGWEGHMEPEVTDSWLTRFMNGVAVNLVGTDSPNNDYPDDKPRYKYLISKKKIDETAAFFGRETFEFYSQCKGTMRVASMARRVITRKLCEQNHALEQHVNWLDGTRTRIAFLDSAWGGDRCCFQRGEFGLNVERQTMMQIYPPELVPISVRSEKEAEQQISEWVKAKCEHFGISPENFGHDSTGRGTLGTYLARVWSARTNPIEFGGVPTDRPVCADIFINDPVTQEKRLKTCKEHYIKFVTELWFSVHYLIAAGQLRGLTEDVMEEGMLRQWNRRSGDRIEIESKLDMKERIGRSPDLFDALSGLVEMARRRGLIIKKLANDAERPASTENWISKRSEELNRLHKAQQLNYSA